jgi:hypothetical protein
MTQADAEFNPQNDLEKRLLSVQRGHSPIEQLIETLVNAEVFILLDHEPIEANMKDASVFAVQNAEGGEFMAVFSSPARAQPIVTQHADFCHGLLVDFRWVLEVCEPASGMIVNPTWPVGLEIPAQGVVEIRQAYVD